MTAAALVAAVLAQQGADSAGRVGRPCRMVIDSVGSYGRQIEERPGVTNFFAGGGVRAHCEGTTSELLADSVAYYGATGRFDMRGNVRLRDTLLTLDATNASYHLREERLDAHRNVTAVNRRSGTVLTGPNLTYLRAAAGVRDTTEMLATSRPTIRYRAEGDTTEPYVVVADRVRLRGDDRMWGAGTVTIDRSDLAARSDSMSLDQGTGRGVLLGRARVDGKGARPYTLEGRRVDLELADGSIRVVTALGEGRLSWGDSGAAERDWITGDTLIAHFVQVADPGGTARPELERIDAHGSARSLTHLADERRAGGPSINYSRGMSIAVRLAGDRVDRVTVTGKADGVHLERMPEPPPATDSTRPR